jgi:hypothetical protein
LSAAKTTKAKILIANSFEFAFIVPIEKQQGLGDK